MHDNSMDAYHAELANLGEREEAIFRWVQEHGPATDREVMAGMGFHDMNMVRPRLTELVDGGALAEVGTKTCPTTGRTVRIIGLPTAAPTKETQHDEKRRP